MSALSHFLSVVSLLAGALAIYQLVQLCREFVFPQGKPYIQVVAAVNLISLAHAVESLLNIIFPPLQFPNAVIHIFTASVILLNLFRIWIPLKLFFFFHLLEDRKWPKTLDWCAYSLMGLLLFGNLLTLADAAVFKGLRLWLISAPYFLFPFFIAFASLMVWNWHQTGSSRSFKRALRSISLFWFGYALLMFLIRFSYRISAVTHLVEMFFLSLVALAFNLLHMAYARKTLKGLKATAVDSLFAKRAHFLSRRHNITEREMEIITLICQGKTNKEIADDLYITAYTVRDHCSSIYRKTGVRNRTQLTSLFRTAPPVQ